MVNILDKNGNRIQYDDYIIAKNGKIYLVKKITETSIKAMLCTRKDRYEYVIPVGNDEINKDLEIIME